MVEGVDASCVVSLRISALSGDVIAEVDVDVHWSPDTIKAAILPAIAPDASEHTSLTLFYDGQDIDAVDSLSSLGLVENDEAYVTALIYDPLALAKMEIDSLHRYAIERSRREAQELRQRLLEQRRELIAQRQLEVKQEFEAERDQPQGPLLMLAYEPANVAESSTQNSIAGEPLRIERAELEVHSLPHAHVSDSASHWQAKARDVAESYESFFDHIAFRKGWKQPPFTRDEVRPAFKRAACIVARARAEVLDVRNTDIKIRQVEGSARDWMHDAESVQLLRCDLDAFVRGLVHATFKDANGYVENLEELQVSSS